MNIMTVFAMIAALITVGFTFFADIASAQIWKLPVCFLAAFLGVLLIYVAGLYIHTLFLGDEPKKENNSFYNITAVHICQIIAFFCNVRTTVINEELIPDAGGFLMVANHRSMFDPLTMIAKFWKHNMIFVSKPENFDIPLVGKIARQAGYLAIDRENNREAMKTILKCIDYIKRDVHNVGIFPEGTRSKDGELLPFHAGSFKIAQKTGVPVVVCCCKNTEQVGKNAPFRRTNVELKILEVIPSEQVVSMSTNDLADYSKSLIAKELGQV